MEDVVLPIRLMKMMGAEILFLTNASGGVNKAFSAGDFMLITDHIASFVPSPLIGRNLDELGPRFPDMSEVYDKDLQDSYGVMTPEDLLKEMVDDPGEYNAFAAVVQNFNGFNTTLEDKVEEAKN